MTQYVINIGAIPNDGTGDPLRTAFNETNLNFDQVFAAGPVLSNVQIVNNTILTTNVNGNLVLNPNGIGQVIANTHVVPDQTRIRNLGSPTQRWNTAYTQYATVYSDLSVGGNLTVQGNIIQIGNIVTDSKTIQLANTATTANAANGSGITVGLNDDIATILYNSTSNAWTTNIGISSVGNITAPYLFGNGSQLTGLAATYSNANVVTLLAGFGSNTVSTTGNISGGYLFGNGSQLTGITAASTYGNANVATFLASFGSNTVSTTGNVNSGNLLTGGMISATGNVTAGNVSTRTITLTNGAVIRDTAGDAVAFGQGAGNISQGQLAVAIGRRAGNSSQGQYAVAIGNDAGATSQGARGVAIGDEAGNTSQGSGAVAIGTAAGQTSQGIYSLAFGLSAGQFTQGSYSVAVGAGAGSNNQGQNAVAIGSSAGVTSQANNSIILNATGSTLDQTTANTFTVKPIRNASSGNVLYYDQSSGEITFDIGGGGSYGNANVVTLLSAFGSNTVSTTGNITANNFFTTANLKIGLNPDILVVGDHSEIKVFGSADSLQIGWEDTAPDITDVAYIQFNDAYGGIGFITGNIQTTQYAMQFDAEGNLAVSGNINNVSKLTNIGNITIDNGNVGNINSWIFATDGSTIFPTLTVTRGDVSIGTITGQTLLFGDATQEAIISTPNGNPTDGINSQRLVINPGYGYNSGEGGDIYLWAGRGGADSGSGGDVKIRGGFAPADGTGGYIRIDGGESQGNGAPGFIEITGGQGGTTTGGYVQITGGVGGNGTGGAVDIIGGFGNQGPGANVSITGGGSANGLSEYGNVNINAGASAWHFDNTGNLTVPGNIIGSGNILIAPDSASSSSYLDIYLTGGPDIHIASNDNSIVIGRDTGANVFVGNDGEVSIRTDNGVTAQVWNFTDTGNLTLPGNTFSVNYANGDPVTFTANTGNVTFSGETVIGTGTSNTVSGLYLAPDPVSLANDLYLRVRGNILDEPTHIHFDTGNNQYYNQYIGDDNKYILLANTGEIVINTNNYAGNTAQWDFGTDGTLTLPAGSSRITSYGQITIETDNNASGMYLNADGVNLLYANANVTLRANSTGTNKDWNFGNTGVLTLPLGGIVSEGALGNTIALTPAGGSDADQQLLVYPTGNVVVDGNHLHLTTGNLLNTELYLGNDDFYVKLANTGDIIVNTAGNTAQWTFGTDGLLTFPTGNLVITPDDPAGNIASIVSTDHPLAILSTGANGAATSLWIEDLANVGTSNIAAVYANPTPGSRIVRIAVGQNGVGSGPNLWDFDTAGTLTLPGGSRLRPLGANLDIFAGTGSYVQLVNSDESSSMGIAGSGGYVTTAGGTWNFGSTGNLTAPGNISAVGNITSGNLTVGSGTITGGNVNGAVFNGNVAFGTGTVGGSGNITGGNLITTGSGGDITMTGGNITGVGNISAGNLIATGNIVLTGSLVGSGASPAPSLSGFSSVSAVTLSASGNVTAGNVSATGNVTAANFFGNGNTLSNVATQVTGSWTVPVGNSTQSFTVSNIGTYSMWVDCNITNGILAWNATATVTNNNVPVVGAQYAWVYNGGGTPIDFTSIPNQFTGTANTIVRSSVAPSATTNRFDFGINNTSGNAVTVRYGYTKIS